MSEHTIKKRIRSGDSQIDHLIDHMSRNKEFAAGKFRALQEKKSLNKEWSDLTNTLNEMGPTKNIEQWKKVWKNQKMLIRKRSSEIKNAERRTGNFPAPPALTERERKVLAIIGKESSQGIGLAEGGFMAELELSQNEEPVDAEEFVPVEDSQSVDSSNYPTSLILPTGDIIMEDVFEEEHSNKNETTKNIPTQIKNKQAKASSREKASLSKGLINIEQYSELVEGTNEGLKTIGSALHRIADSFEKIAAAFGQEK